MRVRFTTDARIDLAEIFKYLADDSPMAAETVFLRIYEACQELSEGARRYPVAFIRNRSELRRRAVSSYDIYFRIGESGVEVVRVVHGARDTTRLFPDD